MQMRIYLHIYTAVDSYLMQLAIQFHLWSLQRVTNCFVVCLKRLQCVLISLRTLAMNESNEYYEVF